MSDLYAFVAMKDGKFGGVCFPDIDRQARLDFLDDFTQGGYTVVSVYSREEYLNLLATDARP